MALDPANYVIEARENVHPGACHPQQLIRGTDIHGRIFEGTIISSPSSRGSITRPIWSICLKPNEGGMPFQVEVQGQITVIEARSKTRAGDGIES